ncbi:hypothetical protein T458_03170 [Brevibacillus panacihumi W25]|uniref:DUF4179 domain-containing protein n=2 Tax=Brevibacillus panacihumi TaxID=497735 RepID=V6MCS2_9BACL|nr:hypothetical protein T458_03170 [Brevibacillus panacihumi W25]
MQHEDKLEQSLNEEKERMQAVILPADLDHYIRKGVDKAKRLQARRKRWQRYGTSLAACLLVVGLFFSIRLSPVVAAYVSHIPGMEKLVELIREDKGLQRAAEHRMVQNVGESIQQGAIRFSVDEVLMDERRMLIFYTLSQDRSDQVLSLHKVELLDTAGNPWGLGGASWSHNLEPGQTTKNRIDFTFEERGEVPDFLQLRATISIDGEEQDTPVNVVFAIDKTKFVVHQPISYEVNQEVQVDSQRFTVESITAYPTQTEVRIRFDPANTKHIFEFDQLELEDEKGATYAFWGNGLPYSREGDDVVIYHLESIYFAKFEQLMLQAKGIRALDKDKLTVTIDARTGDFTKIPDERLRLDALRQRDDVVGMDLSLIVDEIDHSRYVSLLGELTDDLGNEYDLLQSTSSSDYPSKNIQLYGHLFKRLTSHGTPSEYSFTLYSYPTRLTEGFAIKIK